MRLSGLLLTLAMVAAAASPGAKDMAKEAERAERAGETVRAYLLYARAAVADRGNPHYWARAQALRPLAESQATGKLPHPELEAIAAEAGFHPRGESVFGSFTAQDLNDLERMQPPPRLKPAAGKKSYRLRGDAKSLFEQVARDLGYQAIFDRDYNPPADPIRFNIEDADYKEVLHALESATNSFIVPISDGAMLVAQDTLQKRSELENNEAVSIPIPQRTSVQEAQELAMLVQQTMEIRRVVVDPQRRQIMIRDRVSKVQAAQLILRQLSYAKPQVTVDVEFLATGESSSMSLGLDLPTKFPLVDFGSVLHSSPSIPAGFMRFLTFGAGKTFFGIGITDAQLFATATRSSAETVLRSTIAASDGQAATLHVGDKYPIVTSGFFGSGGSTLPGSPGGPGGVTNAVISTTPYVDQFNSPVSTTGEMRLVINGLEFPIFLNDFTNNVSGLQNTISSVQSSVYAAVIQRGVKSRPLSLALIANALGVSSIRLIDDPAGAKVELMKAPDVVSAISNLDYQLRTTVSRNGTLSLVVGKDAFPLTLLENNNLAGLRDAINAAKAGVTAAVLLSTAGNYYLQVVAGKAGKDAIQIFDDPDGAKLPMLAQTDEVNQAAGQLGSTVAGSPSSGLGGLGNFTQGYAPAPTFTFEDLGLVLKVTPTVHGPDEVSLDVEAEFKVLGSGSFNGVPVISTRKFQGKVRLRNSEWAVVAGMVSDVQSKAVNGLPGLMDIPGLGAIFRRNTTSREKTRLLIVLKPHVTSLPASEWVTKTLWIGSESRPLTPL